VDGLDQAADPIVADRQVTIVALVVQREPARPSRSWCSPRRRCRRRPPRRARRPCRRRRSPRRCPDRRRCVVACVQPSARVVSSTTTLARSSISYPPDDECRTATSFTVPVAGFVRQPRDTGDALDVDLRRLRRGARRTGRLSTRTRGRSPMFRASVTRRPGAPAAPGSPPPHGRSRPPKPRRPRHLRCRRG
jgi:hypothetical protein